MRESESERHAEENKLTDNNNNNDKTPTTSERQYNFIILIKGTFKSLPGPTSCKEIHDKDT